MGTIATAKVTLTVEIQVSSTWGDDCAISQVYDQAEKAARGAIVNAIGSRVTIIGTPKVEAIMVTR